MNHDRCLKRAHVFFIFLDLKKFFLINKDENKPNRTISKNIQKCFCIHVPSLIDGNLFTFFKTANVLTELKWPLNKRNPKKINRWPNYDIITLSADPLAKFPFFNSTNAWTVFVCVINWAVFFKILFEFNI